MRQTLSHFQHNSGRVLFLLVFFLVFLPGAVRTQSIDSKGTDFWLMFNYNVTAPTLTVFITSDVATSGTVSIPGLSFSTPFTVAANSVTPVVVPASAATHTSNVIDNKGIRVTALQEVTVYGLNYAPFTTDAYLGLPVDALGTNYIVMSYSGNTLSELGVVGTVNGTTVTITPSVAASGRAAGVPFTITLNQGQTYELGNASDLTGTIISATQPIGVMGANACANIPPGAAFCDHINEMLPPTSAWGTSFATVPLRSRSNGDTWRFLAAEDGTVVTINGVAQPAINRGRWIERILTTQSVVTSNKPILAAQFANGSGFSGNPGDPFMMLIPPLEQFLPKYTVTTVSGYVTHYINIIAPTSIVGTLTLDGVAVPAASFTAIGSTGFSGAQVQVNTGTHNLFGTLPFGVFMYGFNNDDSYGYPGGQSFSAVATVSSVVLSPKSGSASVSSSQCFTATIRDQFNNPVPGIRVDFGITGANPGQSGFAFTNSSGIATFCYAGANSGTDNIVASVGSLNDAGTFVWTLVNPGVYYSKATGDLHNVLTWGLNPDGSGANPSDFNDSTFQLANRPSGLYTMTANWTVNGGKVNIPTGAQLQINGFTFSISELEGAGTVSGSMTSNLTVIGTAGGNINLNFTPGSNWLSNFTVNRTGADASATLGNALNVWNVMTLTTGTLNTGGMLTLKSNAMNTARVAPVTGAIMGDATVERYIPARRAWRILSAPVGGVTGAATGHATMTHTQETVRGTFTTAGGSPRPVSYGTATFSLNAAQTELTMTARIYNIDVNGSQTPGDNNDNLTAAHIHVGAFTGANAGVRWGFFGAPDNDVAPDDLVVVPFASGVGGTFTTKWDVSEGNGGQTLTSSLPDILKGLAYLNFHTVQFAGGEIRGQISLVGAGTQTINQAWQEASILGVSPNPNPFPGYGTHITGGPLFGSVANGFDQSLIVNTNDIASSIKMYNPNINNWEVLQNTNATYVGSDAYMTFVRGDRGIPLSYNSVPPTPTTLRAKGPLKVGDQFYPVSGNGFTAIGNPYASPINFATLTRVGVQNNFYLWDPKMGSQGAYVLLSDNGMGGYSVVPASISPESQYIQSGQGFLVRPTVAGTAGSVTIKESDKSATPSQDVFRTAGGRSTPAFNQAPTFADPQSEQGLRIGLSAQTTDGKAVVLDETFASYKASYADKIDELDAVKMENMEENLGMMRDDQTLMLERRQLPQDGDVIALKLWNTKAQSYVLELNPVRLESVDLIAYVEDRYLKTSTPVSLKEKSQYPFSVSSNPASAQANRFVIVLKKKVDALAVEGKSLITAYPNPVKGSVINLAFTNKAKGVYQVTLTNSAGQVVLRKRIQHAGGTATQPLQLDQKLPKGVYQLHVTGTDGDSTLSVSVQ